MTSLMQRSRDARRRRAGWALFGLLATAALCMPAAGTAAAPVPPAPPGFFGVYGSGMTPQDYDLLRDSDAGAFRTVFPFSAARSKPGQPYDWRGYDNVVFETAQRGIELTPVLYGNPPWLEDERSAVPLRKREAIEEWADFLRAVTARYGPGGSFWTANPYLSYHPVTVWQIWNEPNSITWWAPRPDPKEYALLLNRSATAIHEVDPNARIMTAGIVARPTNRHAIPGKKYLKRLFASRNAVEGADILGFHPFAPSVPGVRGQLVTARKVLRRAGLGELPIWITEIGWGTKGPVNHPLIKTERGQVNALRQTFAMVLREQENLGLERLLWYHWRDSSDDLCRWCESSGLVDKRRRTKDLFDAFQAIAVR